MYMEEGVLSPQRVLPGVLAARWAQRKTSPLNSWNSLFHFYCLFVLSYAKPSREAIQQQKV